MLVQQSKEEASSNMSSSVKLRRKNRESAIIDAEKKRNRFSGGDFLLGSPARSAGQMPRPGGIPNSHQILNQNAELMRKSGDWSYVSFPTAGTGSSCKSPPVTPKMNTKRPLSLMQNQPISLLETKVMASIIHNESKRGQKSLEVSGKFHGK